MKKKIIFTAGGTGGHLFPAQATASELSSCEILFVAGSLSKNRYFDPKRFAYVDISTATFSLSNPLQVVKGGWRILRGVLETLRIFKKFRPDLVVGFGSFFTLPVLIAACIKKIPIVLHEQNASPGKVNRLFSRFSCVTAISFPESSKSLKGPVLETLFPLRRKPPNRENRFGLGFQKPILLIFGGSQGAAKLNEIFLQGADSFSDFQILHFTGNETGALQAKKTYEDLNIAHYVKPFEPDIHLAMELADVVICRSGASTIAELIEFEKPALLIPFPFATEDHQVKNAKHFTQVIGGGEMCLEKDLDKKTLDVLVGFLFQNRFEKKRKIQEYKKQKALKPLSHVIEDVLKNEQKI